MSGVVNYRLSLSGIQFPDGSTTKDIESTYNALIYYYLKVDRQEEDTPWQRHFRCDLELGKDNKLFNITETEREHNA